MGLLSEEDEWQEEEKESREEREVSESVLARGRYISFMGVSETAGEMGWMDSCAGTKDGWE